MMNKKIKSHLETPEGKIMFCIVREFLEFFNMDCTLSVYESESYLGKLYHRQERNTVVEELGLKGVDVGDSPSPLLLMLIRCVQLVKNESKEQAESTSISEEIKINEAGVKNSIGNLNSTFNVSNPTVTLSVDNKALVDNLSSSEVSKSVANTQNYDSFTNESDEIEDIEVSSQPFLKDSKSSDKNYKAEKNKSKNTVPETSPLQNNKTRVSDILPSLFNKEYKDKSGIRDLDKMFDMDIEYEEDFMQSSDISLKYDCLNSNSNNVVSDKSLKTVKNDLTSEDLLNYNDSTNNTNTDLHSDRVKK